MGLAVFIGLVFCAAVVLAFMGYGAYLGLAILVRQVRGLWWRVNAYDLEMATATAGGNFVGTLPSGEQPEGCCWERKLCRDGAREWCPAHQQPDLPCWLAKMQADGQYRLKPECLACELFNIPALMTHA